MTQIEVPIPSTTRTLRFASLDLAKRHRDIIAAVIAQKQVELDALIAMITAAEAAAEESPSE